MSAPEWPDALTKDVARCAKKHKTASAAASDGADRVLEALQQARAAAAAGQDAAAVAALRARLAEVGASSSAAATEAAKELSAVVGKLGKARAPPAVARARWGSARPRAARCGSWSSASLRPLSRWPPR